MEERGRVSGREVVLRNASGEDVPVRVFGVRIKAPVPAPDARRGGGHGGGGPDRHDVDRYLLLLHDLTEVHRIRRRLIETEKLSAMAKIAGSVAHEFRNPLNSLFLATDLLEDELEGRQAVQESIAPTLAAIREEIERLNQIITHYLALSKISSASPEVMDLSDVVRGFAEENEPRCAEQDVELRVRADGGDHHITADPNQVRRILVNLVENALDAVREMEEGEEGRGRRRAVTLLLRRMRRSVKLTVKDNGPGIPDELRERVFEPFFTSKAGGSGLGLYLVREIALGSGGTMTLSSAVGRGTSVSIRWPFVDRSLPPA
jgi:signal transduction histidine kinase